MQVKSAATRGRDFEVEIAELLRVAGFDVTLDSGVARPRQTDLFARGNDVDILVEAKDRGRNVDVGDIDDLRSRLGRTTADVVGAIFTTADLTKGAIRAIEIDRTREVLVFVGEEIDHVRSSSQSLRALVERKRNELRIHGRAWFGSAMHSEFVGVRLPRGSTEFKAAGEKRPYFESRSNFAASSYSLQLPDSGWGNLGGEGARLSIPLTIHRVEDLRNIFGYLHQKFGLSNNGMFSIHQSGSCWHGVGAENFLRTIEQPSARYSQSLSQDFHHSEECNYFDRFRNGWLEFSCQREVDFDLQQTRSFLHRSELVIQLPGVPVDPIPFVQLCRYTGNDWANFEYVGERLTFGRRLKKALVLSIVGIVLNKEFSPKSAVVNADSVSGVIARNPFYRKKSIPRELLSANLPPLDGLRETELLLCSLRHWHEDGDKVDNYMLDRIEVTTGGAGVIIRPIANWGRILKRATEDHPSV